MTSSLRVDRSFRQVGEHRFHKPANFLVGNSIHDGLSQHGLKSLSKGGRAKVALALSLAHNPSLLILDEPTSGLDPLVRREFLESMIDLASEGRTVLISSHQVSEVERVADIVAILINGRLVSFDRLEELKRSVREVAISTNSVGLVPVSVPGQVLAHVAHSDEHQYLVRDLDEAALRGACSEVGLATPRIRHPSLEDILLAMLRDQRRHETPVIQHDPWTTPAVAAEAASVRI